MIAGDGDGHTELETGSNSMSGVNSTNETCYDLTQVPRPVLAIYALFISVIIAATLIGNGIILLLVAKYKVLRTRSVVANLSLIFADVLWCLSYHTPALVSASSTSWAFGDIGCSAFGLLSFEFILTRWLVLAVMCADRFCTVRFPFSYTKYSKCILAALTITAWALPFLVAVFPAVSKISEGEFRPNVPTCLYSCSSQFCRFYYGILVTLSFVVGALIPTILYIWLYKRARSLRPTQVVLGQLALQTAAGPIIDQCNTISYNYPEKWSRDIHGYITFILIIVTFMVTAGPAYISQIFRSSDYEDWCKIPIFVHFLIQLIFFSSTALDPLVIMRNRDFRQCFKHMISFRKKINPFIEGGDIRRSSVDILSPPTPIINGRSMDLKLGVIGSRTSCESESSISSPTPLVISSHHQYF